MASLTWWTRVWVSSGSWWWTGKPGVLQSVGSQTVKHDWMTELNWIGKKKKVFHIKYFRTIPIRSGLVLRCRLQVVSLKIYISVPRESQHRSKLKHQRKPVNLHKHHLENWVWGNGHQGRYSGIQNVSYSFLMLCVHSVTHQIMTVSTKRVKSTGPDTTGHFWCLRHSPFLQNTHYLSVRKNMHRTHGEKPPATKKHQVRCYESLGKVELISLG